MVNLPPNKTEEEVLEAIERVVLAIAPSFAFGYYSVEDIAQEARCFALQALKKYDSSRPLENFLYTHVKNRLCNLRRDKLHRSDAPCLKCHNGQPCNNGHFCRKYQSWHKRNSAKANLMRPVDINYISDENENNTRLESTTYEDTEIRELCRLVDEKLPMELREQFLQMRAGISIPKAKREEIEMIVRGILCEERDNGES